MTSYSSGVESPVAPVPTSSVLPSTVPGSMVPVSMVIELLREAGTPLDAVALRQRLVTRGLNPEQARSVLRRARRLPGSEVLFDPVRREYRLGAGTVPPMDGEEALERLLPRRPSGRQAELAAVVRGALKERADLEARLRAGYAGGRELRAAHDRQVRIDAVRALVDVLGEVEELAAAGADAAIAVERVRAMAAGFGLTPIGRAGEDAPFVPAWHTPIGTRPPDESRVTVIRPGYSWRDGEEVVLISKAQVTVHSGE
jgi:hypothetical protein